MVGAGLLLAPPALWFILYWIASGTGCAGGDCMGPMIGLFLIGGLGALVSLIGLGFLLQTAYANLTR